MKDWDYGPTFSWVDILHRVNRRTAKALNLTLWACHAVAVGPVSLSPSPITATVIWLGLSMILLFFHQFDFQVYYIRALDTHLP